MIAILDYLEINTELSDNSMETAEFSECREIIRLPIVY